MNSFMDVVNSKVSIIVPAFNAQKYIERCIVSLQKQSHDNIEIIVVNDGSTDSTGEILSRLEKDDSRIRVITQMNSGVSEARNNGISAASGEWIMFCDSDDEYLPGTVQRMLSETAEKDFDVISGSHTVVTASGARNYVEVKEREFFDRKSITEYFLTEGENRNFIWDRIYKKSIFDNIKFKSGRYYEDVIFSIDLCRNINSFKVFNESVYDYKLNETSLTNGVRKEVHMDLLKARLEQLDFVKENYPQMESRVYDLILTACCFIMSRFALGKVDRHDEDYQKLINVFREYKKIAPKDTLYIKVACVLFNISPYLLARLCKVYSEMKNK